MLNILPLPNFPTSDNLPLIEGASIIIIDKMCVECFTAIEFSAELTSNFVMDRE